MAGAASSSAAEKAGVKLESQVQAVLEQQRNAGAANDGAASGGGRTAADLGGLAGRNLKRSLSGDNMLGDSKRGRILA